MNTLDWNILGWFVAGMAAFIGIVVWGCIGIWRIDRQVARQKATQKKLESDFIDTAEVIIHQLKQLSESHGAEAPRQSRSGIRSAKAARKSYNPGKSYVEEPAAEYGEANETTVVVPDHQPGWVSIASTVIALLEVCKRDEVISKQDKITIQKLEADFMTQAEALVTRSATMNEDVAALYKLLSASYKQGSIFTEAMNLIQLRKRLRMAF